ncbi:MAG: SH3 domain-containing protein [Chloroflexi bacterium]|nr:SH3 domain-containing protein [Chloroflexota bacterium]MCA2002363.1 SH3 domain-containing protein [Chloroflexota bacterium]
MDQKVATAAALTVEAALQAEAAQTTPTSLPPTATQVSTPTFTQPVISVGDVINCRKGPGTSYERITQIMPGETVNIVGFFPPNYWVVASKEGECWLSGEFTTPAGSFAAVPTVTAPPTPQGGAPKAATFPKNGWTFYCYSGQADITLSWNDNANNESGYRILRNGEAIAELPANSTYFAETISLLSGQSAAYQIQAYNSAGESVSATANIACP